MSTKNRPTKYTEAFKKPLSRSTNPAKHILKFKKNMAYHLPPLQLDQKVFARLGK